MSGISVGHLHILFVASDKQYANRGLHDFLVILVIVKNQHVQDADDVESSVFIRKQHLLSNNYSYQPIL
jgi:hypothetical protein